MDKELEGVSHSGSAPGEESAGFAARRRVIKGCVGLPAIVTLASGRAEAQASAFQCVTNQEELNLPTDRNTTFIAFDDAENCPNPEQFQTNVFDCGQDTAVRDSSVETAVEGQTQNPNLVLVDENGNVDLDDGLPTVRSCYASIVNSTTTSSTSGEEDGVFSRLRAALLGQR